MIKSNIIYIIIIALVYGAIYNIVVLSKFKDKVNQDWRYYRCQPYILPISGLFRTEKNKGIIGSTLANLKRCNWVTLQKYFTFLISPFRFILSIITAILQKFKSTIDTFRQQLRIMRKFLFGMMEKIMERIQNISSGLIYLISKMRETMKRSYANYKLLNHYTTTTNYTLRSIMQGPIGQVGKFASAIGIIMIAFFPGPIIGAPFIGALLGMCFDPDTLIRMKKGHSQKISTIKLGDELFIGGKVTSLFQISLQNLKKDLYTYLGTTVSGSHLVLENHKWLRVEESNLAEPIDYQKNTLICLNTQDNIIGINQTIFRDFRETTNPLLNLKIERLVMRYLNLPQDIITTNEDILHQYEWGFGGTVLIKLKGGTSKSLANLGLGDETLSNGFIQSIISHAVSDIQMYTYRDLPVAGSQVVFENGVWLRVHQSSQATPCDYMLPIYHIVTSTGFITISNVHFTDYYESRDDTLNSQIDSLVMKNLNKTPMSPIIRQS